MNSLPVTYVVKFTDSDKVKREVVFTTRRYAILHLNHLILDCWYTDARLVRRQGKQTESPVATSFVNAPKFTR